MLARRFLKLSIAGGPVPFPGKGPRAGYRVAVRERGAPLALRQPVLEFVNGQPRNGAQAASAAAVRKRLFVGRLRRSRIRIADEALVLVESACLRVNLIDDKDVLRCRIRA